ncbi:MAG: alpha/beta hydrolase [Polymorphobacter sp.]|uniref:alpha/beta hydrolase n=1 Tax=Polymorphobacter sp. TaxID=1909290 RepID=UPI003A846386
MTPDDTLHPVLAEMLRAVPRLPAGSQTPAEARAAMKTRMAPLVAGFAPKGAVSDHLIPTSHGGIKADLPVRLVRPNGADTALPVIVFFHGGGWVVCDNDTHLPMADALAEASGAAVLMVDYALAPEAPFPAAIEDGRAAIDWLAAAGADLGLDAARVALAGDSAGGNLAAVMARDSRDRGVAGLRAQYLIYPAIDLPDPARHASYADCGAYGLSGEDMAWYWSLYAGGATPGPDLLPLMADLEGLAPALVHTARFDVLRDEGHAYAAALARAGVEVSAKCWPGMIHGFLSMRGMVDSVDVAIGEAGAWLRVRLA